MYNYASIFIVSHIDWTTINKGYMITRYLYYIFGGGKDD